MANYIDSGQPANSWLECRIRQPLNGPDGRFALEIDLSIAKGDFVLLTGPSGAGKTTLLRCLAGFQRPQSGHLRVNGRIWSDHESRMMLPVQRRPIGFVFQDYALFPNMSLRGNLDYALGRKAPPGEALRLLELVDLAALASSYPAELSGGQKQRLALIRALARRPELLMLDEPLSALDPVLRARMQDELLRLHAEFGTTTLMISHDPLEIARLADRILRLEAGRITGDTAGPRHHAAGAPPQLVHLSGPDARGICRAMLGGQLLELSYALPPGELPPGTPLTISAPG